MREVVFHRVVITDEAVCDYCESLYGRRIDCADINKELSEYLTVKQSENRLVDERYFRVKYFDAQLDRMLMLFVYRGQKLRCMQNWEVRGVCFAEDWDEDSEYCGRIRSWVEGKITDLPDEPEWQIRHRMLEVYKTTEKTAEKKIIAEVLNAFECSRDKERAKELLFLSDADSKRKGGSQNKRKAGSDRKLHRST